MANLVKPKLSNVNGEVNVKQYTYKASPSVFESRDVKLQSFEDNDPFAKVNEVSYTASPTPVVEAELQDFLQDGTVNTALDDLINTAVEEIETGANLNGNEDSGSQSLVDEFLDSGRADDDVPYPAFPGVNQDNEETPSETPQTAETPAQDSSSGEPQGEDSESKDDKKEPESSEEKPETSTPAPSSNNNSGKYANTKDGNIISTSEPFTQGTKYNLTDDELAYLAYVAKREQGTVEGAKIELSLMANLYEKNKSKYSSVQEYVQKSGWFGKKNNYKYPGDEYVQVAKEVLNDGNRYLDTKVVEHDCISDIKSVSTGSIKDRSSYIPGETIIENVYGAKYVFVGFAPNGGDPFGYLVN